MGHCYVHFAFVFTLMLAWDLFREFLDSLKIAKFNTVSEFEKTTFF